MKARLMLVTADGNAHHVADVMDTEDEYFGEGDDPCGYLLQDCDTASLLRDIQIVFRNAQSKREA